jgi:uncharacterized protein DUF4399
MRMVAWAILAALIGATTEAAAQTPATGGPTPSLPGARAYFIDLKDGAVIGPRTTIHFGLHGMGVAPAGSDMANTGHHHLLIDTDLPPLDEPIPNDDNHLHFGGGQTETELSLPLGPHTLQLLLGDANHIPHTPPVMSDRIHVTVTETAPTPAAQPAAGMPDRHTSPPGAKVYFISPADGATVPLTFNARFGLENMGVAPAGVDKANTGHHHVLIDVALPPLGEPIPNDENHLHFGAGQTEAMITLAPGRHTLQLLLGDANHIPHVPPVFSQPITIFASSMSVAAPAPAPAARRAPRHHYTPPRKELRRPGPLAPPPDENN